MRNFSEFRLSSRHSRVLAGLKAYIFLGGLISFIGWAANLPRLTDWANNGISIQPNATIAVTASGAALIFLGYGFRRSAAVLGAVVAFIGGSALFQILTGVDLGIDSILMFGRTFGRTGVLAPGRMGPPGATSWMLIGLALMLSSTLPRNARARSLAVALAVVTAGSPAFR